LQIYQDWRYDRTSDMSVLASATEAKLMEKNT
jgi:hypothetical protein